MSTPPRSSAAFNAIYSPERLEQLRQFANSGQKLTNDDDIRDAKLSLYITDHWNIQYMGAPSELNLHFQDDSLLKGFNTLPFDVHINGILYCTPAMPPDLSCLKAVKFLRFPRHVKAKLDFTTLTGDIQYIRFPHKQPITHIPESCKSVAIHKTEQLAPTVLATMIRNKVILEAYPEMLSYDTLAQAYVHFNKTADVLPLMEEIQHHPKFAELLPELAQLEQDTFPTLVLP